MSTKLSLSDLADLRNSFSAGDERWRLLSDTIHELAMWRAFATTQGVALPIPRHEGAELMAQKLAEIRGFTRWTPELIPQLREGGIYLLILDNGGHWGWRPQLAVWGTYDTTEEGEDEDGDYCDVDVTYNVFVDTDTDDPISECSDYEGEPSEWSGIKGILLIDFERDSAYMQEQLRNLGCARIPKQDQLNLR